MPTCRARGSSASGCRSDMTNEAAPRTRPWRGRRLVSLPLSFAPLRGAAVLTEPHLTHSRGFVAVKTASTAALATSLCTAAVLAAAIGTRAQTPVRLDRETLAAIPQRLVGPSAPSGRVWSVVGVPSQPKTFYACTAEAGVWRTTNNGTTITQI